MLFLDNQLPRALLDAVHSVVVGETGVGFDSRNATYSDGSSNHLENATWKTVASRCPLTSLWLLAVLVALTALAIVSILLKLFWSLARAKLCFLRVYKLHYSAPTFTTPFGFDYSWDLKARCEGKTRSLYLPAEGSVLLCLLTTCLATVVRAVSVEIKGRAVWLSQIDTTARIIEYTGLWLAIIFIIAGSICHISLFTTKTSPAYFLELSNDVIPILPKEISKPALHPLLITTIVFIVPVFLCILPNSLTFSRTYSTVNTFEGLLPRLSGPYGSLEDVISSMPLSQNGTSTKPEDASLAVITAGITSILGSWRMENLMRACTGAVLLVILIFIEYALQKRLSQAGMYLQEVERAALNGSPAANSAIMIKNDGPNMTDFLDEKGGAYIQSTAGRSINRTRSILSSSTRSDVRPSSLYPSEGPRRPQSALSRSCVSHPGLRPSSRASSNRSFSAMSVSSSKLYVPELPEFDVTLPSPSLMKDDLESSIRGIGGEGPSPYLPALALFGDRLDRSVGCFGGHTLFGEESGLSSSRTPSLSRRISLTSSLNYSEKAFEPRKRPTSTIPEQITPIPDYNEKKLDDTTQDYFGDGQLPYDIDDGYDAQLDKSECSAAVAHMLAPYDGAEEEERDVGHSIPTYMQRDDTRRSHLSRSYTPGLRNEHNLRMSVRSPSVASRRSHIHVRPQSRASSYSYRSQSSLKSSTFSYSSKRTAASWRSKLFQHETYQGPSASNLRALKSSRIIEATLLGLFILVASLLELVCGIAGWSILESKALQTSMSLGSMLLKILPILGGVILSALRSSEPAYGWQTRHVIVKSIDEGEGFFKDGASYRSGLRS